MAEVNSLQYLKAIIAGVIVLILGNLMYVGVLQKIEHYNILRNCILCIPLIAAILTSYITPRWKVLMGASIGLWGAIIGVLSANLYQHFGFKIDSIGTVPETFMIIFIYQTFLGVIGGVLIKALQSK